MPIRIRKQGVAPGRSLYENSFHGAVSAGHKDEANDEGVGNIGGVDCADNDDGAKKGL